MSYPVILRTLAGRDYWRSLPAHEGGLTIYYCGTVWKRTNRVQAGRRVYLEQP